MAPRFQPIPRTAKDAADRGELIAAIQITQDTTGMQLLEAQQAVHAYLRGAQSAPNAVPGQLPAQALASLQRGNLIEAIKHTREATGLGLKEAKDAVERYVAENPHAKPQPAASAPSSVNFAPILGSLFVGVIILALVFWFAAKG